MHDNIKGYTCHAPPHISAMMALYPQPLLTDKLDRHPQHLAMSVGVSSYQSSMGPTAGSFNTRSITTSSSSSGPRRPKLSVNTSDLPPAFSTNKSTSLRLETLSVTSPTSRNTFSNSYGHPSTPVARKPRLNVDLSLASTPVVKPVVSTPHTTSPPESSSSPLSSSTPSAESATSISSTGGTVSTPYRVSFNLPSVLKNGPIPRKRRRVSPSTPIAMFPSTKRVAFRPQLTEEIRTSTYTLRHCDIESALPSPSLPPPQPTEAAPLGSELDDEEDAILIEQPVARLSSTPPRAGEKRESSDEEDDDDEDNALYPKTPVAGRQKRMRDWTWTLDPVEGSDSPQTTQ